MRINTKCSIALHCLVVIHEFQDEKKITSEVLSKSTGCNAAAIRSFLRLLQKAGIVSVARGVGGATLNVEPDKLTIWDVYKALDPEGLECLMGMHPSPSTECPVGQQMPLILKNTYKAISDAVRETMKGITLQDILDDYYKISEEK